MMFDNKSITGQFQKDILNSNRVHETIQFD